MASPFSLPGRRCCVRGRAAGGRGPGAGGGWERVLCWDEALYPHIFLWEREPGSSVALPPSVASSAQGPSAFCLPSGVMGFGLHFGFLPFPFLSPPFLSFPPSDGKHGLCSCQPREARLPPTGIVMEGNLGAAPLRRLPGIPPRRVETRGGWDFLPPLFWGRVWFPFCLLVFLACRRGVGGGGGCPHHPCLSAWLSGCRQVTSKCTPVPGLPALLRHRGSTLGLRRPVLPRVL